jgi:putative membrane protein
MQGQNGSHQERARFPTWFAAIALAVLIAVVIMVLVMFYISSRYTGYGSSWGWGMMNGYGSFPMLFIAPIMLIALAVIGYALYRWLGRGGGCCGRPRGGYGYHSSDVETSMEILRRRYAKGEITKDQFEQMKKDITN